MRKFKFLILSVFLTMSSLGYGGLIFDYDNLFGMTIFSSLEAPNVNTGTGPLNIHRGDELTLKCSFGSPCSTNKVKIKCQLFINGVPVPVSSRYDGIQLPLEKDNFVTCYIMIPIKSSFPAITGKLRIEILDSNDTLMVGADVKVKIS